MTGDGTDEVLVADANGLVALIEADGRVLWSDRNTRPLLAATTARLTQPQDRERQIVLVGADNIRVLAPSGSLIWSTALPEQVVESDAGAVAEGETQPTIAPIRSRPVQVAAYDSDGDGLDEIVVLWESGDLLAFGPAGQQLWRLSLQEGTRANVQPQMIVEDFDGDGGSEIAVTIFTPRRFSQLLFVNDNAVVWRQSISRRVTSIAAAPFRPNRTMIAVGTNFGQLDLYDPSGERLWFRTVNRSITAMTAVTIQGAPALLVGTQAGSVIAYTEVGRRLWTTNLANSADRQVLAISPVAGTPAAGQPGLAVTLESRSAAAELADILLLNQSGQVHTRLGETDLPGVSDLVDVNRDNYPELLLARFANLQLLGLGVGDSDYAQGWVYNFNSAPRAVLFVDLDLDGEDEVVIGSQDGRLHAIGSNQALRWLHAPGNEIAHLATFIDATVGQPRLVVVRTQVSAGAPDERLVSSWLELRDAEGEMLWRAEVRDEITALDTALLPGTNTVAIMIGTRLGDVAAFDQDGQRLWSRRVRGLAGDIRRMAILDAPSRRSDLLLIGGTDEIYAMSLTTNAIIGAPYARFADGIADFFVVDQPGDAETAIRALVFSESGQVYGLNWRGAERVDDEWPHSLDGSPRVIEEARALLEEANVQPAASFLVALDAGSLIQLDVTANRPQRVWSVAIAGNAESVDWGDLDQNGRLDASVLGTQEGGFQLAQQLPAGATQLVLDQRLGSPVSAVSLSERATNQSPHLFAVTDNGQVRLYREAVNRPPLLSNPRLVEERGQIDAGVFINDVDGDPVTVRLELYDGARGEWVLGNEEIVNAPGQVFWQDLQVTQDDGEVVYRFSFDDGLNRGFLTPPPGLVAAAGGASSNAVPVLVSLLSIGLAFAAIAFARQSGSPQARARRFYQRLTPASDQSLRQIEQRYTDLDGSPDFLMQLANTARQEGDSFVSEMADGLFLLPNRPQAGLSIIVRALDDERPDVEGSDHLEQRRQLYATAQSMVEAPSITELSLLRPQLEHLLTTVEAKGGKIPVMEGFLPVLTNLRDSERVDSVDDRLVYLNQASVRLRQMQEQLSAFEPSVERTLAKAIARRWAGLVGAEIEEQRGRAELQLTLMTRRIVPNGDSHVAVEIRNTGRAAAENIVATLEQNPAYRVIGEPQLVPFLPSGRSRQIRFQVEPYVDDRFRVSLLLSYDDRNRHNRSLAFGDMVSLLPPAREFRPIPNPYLPGTPLRRESPLFYGREELFDFIAENAGGESQRNVMMLVGQRRTGKTSLLLRLEEHLPNDLLPVYIDCQSLGIMPGMPALLNELAWHITDALKDKGMQLTVPDTAEWERDPGRTFQKAFIPQALEVMPDGAKLLLVFDEFEAFEAMVNDGILPSTFFTYMRHLMQHSTGLSFIFVGARRLEEMSADYWSVLFNIALYRKIDYLSEAAATRLICEPVAPNLVYDDLAIDKILRVTAGHPYFLQLVCYTLVKRANQEERPYVTISDVNDALDEMLRLGEVHFAYLWQRSSNAERALLTAAAHLIDRNEPLHPEQLAEYLEKFNIELDAADVTNALTSLVERDILREVTEEGKALYELRIGLVGQWVARNKSLSKLYALQDG